MLNFAKNKREMRREKKEEPSKSKRVYIYNEKESGVRARQSGVGGCRFISFMAVASDTKVCAFLARITK